MKTLDQIAAELQGYDPNALPADAVDEFLSRLVKPLTQTERVGLFDALNRVLAADLIAPLNVPPHDNSAMDGYAVAGSQLQAGQDLRLRVVGTAFALHQFARRCAPPGSALLALASDNGARAALRLDPPAGD